MGRSTKGDRVERATEVPDVHGAAEARDRAGRAARRPQREGGLPRARDLGDALLRRGAISCSRPGGRRWRARRSASGEKELRRKIRELERALGRKTYELEIAGEALRGWE